MDQNVGRVIAALKAQGRYDNTIILFFADNGPEGNVIEAPSPRFKVGSPDAALPPAQALGIDNSLDNIGKPTSYVGYGPGWAQANSVPSWLVKGYTTEGGIRLSAFAAGRGGPAAGGSPTPIWTSATSPRPCSTMRACVSPASSRSCHPALEGHSLRPVLSSTRGPSDPPTRSGYELFFRRALRQGDWKIVFLPKPTNRYTRGGVSTGRWQLFNVSKDPAKPRISRGGTRAAGQPRGGL